MAGADAVLLLTRQKKMTPRLSHSRYFWILITAFAALSLWLRMAFPIVAAGSAIHDDLLFVRWAAEIGMGNWLGEYNNLTHAKGVGYSLFLLLNHATGLPLKFTEHALYLATAGFFAFTIGQLYRSRAATLLTFVLLAFFPTAWVGGAAGRVVREGLYISQSLMLLTLGIRCFVLHEASSPAKQVREHWLSLVLLGLLGGWFWITREEGVWLAPAMTVLVAYWLFRQRAWRENFRAIGAFLAVPIVALLLVIGIINTINFAFYGVFRNNDFRSSDFQAGYGALSRIKHEHWRKYVPFPKDAREKAYEMSAAARELKPFFEGPGGQMWLSITCSQPMALPCDEIQSGWLMWAVRDAASGAGHYVNAGEAKHFYRRLAKEIDEGCRQRPDDCLPARATMVPPWHQGYAADTLLASWKVFHTLATLGDMPPYVSVSEGGAKYLALYEVVTNGPLAPVQDAAPAWDGHALKSPRDALRMQLASSISTGVNQLSSYGLPLAFCVWLLWSIAALYKSVRQKRIPDPAWWVTTAVAMAVITRVLLLGFLDATSIPSNNMLYLFPLVPLSLAMLPVTLWGAINVWKSTKVNHS